MSSEVEHSHAHSHDHNEAVEDQPHDDHDQHDHHHHQVQEGHGHSHSHDHLNSTSTENHQHAHAHIVYNTPSDDQPQDIALWNNHPTTDDDRLTRAHGLLDHPHAENGQDFQHNDAVLLKLQRASMLCATFLLVEVIGGYLSGSLAILSDASHLCADLASFAVAMGASYLARLPKTAHHTFGLKRVESLAALLSMLSLALISVALGVEALRRIYIIVWHTTDDGTIQVEGFLMSGIAFLGVLVNVALAFVLGEHHVHLPSDGTTGCGSHHHAHNHPHNHEDCHDDQPADETTPLTSSGGHDHNNHSHEHSHRQTSQKISASDDPPRPIGAFIPFLPKNINLQAAYLHVLGDLAQSVAVLIAGLIIWAVPSWTIVDPLCTLLFCTLVGYSTVGVLRTSVAILLQEVPPSVDWKSVYDAIAQIDGVSNVHDLHIWSISHGIPILSVHCQATDPERAMEQIYCVCRDFGIVHTTIQVQAQSGGECITCTDRICRLCQYADQAKNGASGISEVAGATGDSSLA